MRFEIREPREKVNHKEFKVFDQLIWQRIKRNRNAIVVVNGGTGSGKSYACLRMAEDLSTRFETHFSIENNLAFKFTDLLRKMQKVENKPGTCFVMEEVGSIGSGGSSREWQSEANKFFFSFLQTSRFLNQILILNCPSFSYLEKGARELVHFQLESQGINYPIKRSVFKAFTIQTNTRSGKQYFKYPRFYDGSKRIKVNRVMFGMPSKPLLRKYEKAKKEFMKGLIGTMLQESETKGEARLNLVLQLLKEKKNIKEIAEFMSSTERRVRQQMDDLLAKGYLIIPAKKEGKRIISYKVVEKRETKRGVNLTRTRPAAPSGTKT